MSFWSSILPAVGTIAGTAIGGPVGGAIGGALGSAVGGSMASNQAANQQVAQGNNALALQQQMYNQTQQNLSPFMQAGQGALPGLSALGQQASASAPGAMNTMNNLAGFNGPNAVNAAMMADPSYAWRLKEGLKGVMANRAAMGGTFSGGTLQSLNNYAQGAASQEYGNIFNRANTQYGNLYGNMNNLAGMGQNAAVGLGGFGANYGNQAGQNMMGIGNVQAAATMAGQNAGQTGVNNWMMMNALGGNNQNPMGGGLSNYLSGLGQQYNWNTQPYGQYVDQTQYGPGAAGGWTSQG